MKIASANMKMASPTGDQEKMHVGVGCGKSSGLLRGSPGFLRSYCAAFADPRACCVGLLDFSGPAAQHLRKVSHKIRCPKDDECFHGVDTVAHVSTCL
jgi:hypothetical protein